MAGPAGELAARQRAVGEMSVGLGSETQIKGRSLGAAMPARGASFRWIESRFSLGQDQVNVSPPFPGFNDIRTLQGAPQESNPDRNGQCGGTQIVIETDSKPSGCAFVD